VVMKATIIRLPRDQLAEIDALAELNDRTRAAEIRRAIRAHLAAIRAGDAR